MTDVPGKIQVVINVFKPNLQFDLGRLLFAFRAFFNFLYLLTRLSQIR